MALPEHEGRERDHKLLHERQPGLLGQQDFVNSQTEHNFRQKYDASAEAATPKRAAPATPVPQPSIVFPPTQTPPVPNIIDRLHKRSFNDYGAYIYVAKDHQYDLDQAPPTNPGYRGTTDTASTIAGALALAVSMLPNVRHSRIAIYILGGRWDEDLTINDPHIDFFGCQGRAMLHGHIDVREASDAKFFGLEFSSPDTLPALHYFASPDSDPTILPAEIRDCNFYGAELVFQCERRIYADGCLFKQTTSVDWTKMIAPVKLTFMTPAPSYIPGAVAPYHTGKWIFNNCTFESWLFWDGPHTGLDGSTVFNVRPAGWAIEATHQQPALSWHRAWSTNPLYYTPNSGLWLFGCNVYGSLNLDSWIAEHDFCVVAGGCNLPDAAGGFYARQLSRPLFDGDGNYLGSVGSQLILNHTNIHAVCAAQWEPYPSSNPGYVGECYAIFRHATHMRRIDHTPSKVIRGVGAADGHVFVTNSSTGANNVFAPGHEWDAPSNFATLSGSCPVNVIANISDFLI